MERRRILLIALATAAGCILLTAVGYLLVGPTLVANRSFAQIQLGDTRASVIAALGKPRSQVPSSELDRYSDCEIDEASTIQTVDLWVKGADLLYLVGYSNQQVAAKCSAAW